MRLGSWVSGSTDSTIAEGTHIPVFSHTEQGDSVYVLSLGTVFARELIVNVYFHGLGKTYVIRDFIFRDEVCQKCAFGEEKISVLDKYVSDGILTYGTQVKLHK